MAKPITFYGAESLLQGFKNTQVEAWSISASGQFWTKGIGYESLKAFLEIMDSGSKNTIYTLRIYEDVTDSKQIKEKTEADGSFNFVLCEKESDYYEGEYSDTNRKNRLFQRLSNLETVVAKLAEQKEEPEEEDQSFIGAITRSIKSPRDLLELVNVGKSMLGMPIVPIPSGFGTIGSVPGTTPQQPQQPDPDKIRRAQEAITILDQNDPDLVDHLEKLARLSVENKGKFKNLLSMLDLIQ